MPNIDLLRPLLHQGLLDCKFSGEQYDFKSWVSSGKYLVRGSSCNGTVELEPTSDHDYTRMLAYDACRFATSSFESVLHLNETSGSPKSTAWLAIKAYYAAFFSAHSILRCFGHTCSQLESGHVNQIHTYANAIGINITFPASAGLFIGNYNQSNRELSLSKAGNTHEDTWKAFKKLLEDLSIKVLQLRTATNPAKQACSADIDSLVNLLTQNGRHLNGVFLSRFRNAVNYRHEHSVWHPYSKHSVKANKVTHLISQWDKENIVIPQQWSESKDCYDFFNACTRTINLSYLLVELISNNTSERANWFIQWPRKFLKQTLQKV